MTPRRAWRSPRAREASTERPAASKSPRMMAPAARSRCAWDIASCMSIAVACSNAARFDSSASSVSPRLRRIQPRVFSARPAHRTMPVRACSTSMASTAASACTGRPRWAYAWSPEEQRVGGRASPRRHAASAMAGPSRTRASSTCPWCTRNPRATWRSRDATPWTRNHGPPTSRSSAPPGPRSPGEPNHRSSGNRPGRPHRHRVPARAAPWSASRAASANSRR